MAIKIAGSALKCRVGRVSGNTVFFFLGLIGFSVTMSFNTNAGRLIHMYFQTNGRYLL